MKITKHINNCIKYFVVTNRMKKLNTDKKISEMMLLNTNLKELQITMHQNSNYSKINLFKLDYYVTVLFEKQQFIVYDNYLPDVNIIMLPSVKEGPGYILYPNKN